MKLPQEMRLHKRFERYYLFSVVAECLNFGQAADKLGISRSYLSTQINALERDLDVTLLIRTTRSVRLTQAGQKVLSQMQGVNSSVQTMEKEIRKSASAIEGKLTITCAAIFGQRYLTPACRAFRKLHPDIEFDIDIGYTNQDLTQQPFDLAIRATNTPPANMIAKHLMDYQHLCCASPDYLNLYGTPQTPEELARHNCLSDPHLTTWRYQHQGFEREVETKGQFYANDNFLLYEAAVQGEGIIKLPDYLVQPAIQKGQLTPILTSYFTQTRGIYLIFPQQLKQSEALLAFAQFLQNWVTSSSIN
ncbi:LysR family transcriptional regulator [Vibrio nigripulchritudo]|uniref:LysR family transcriptional regulator n=1 Tax=Vibrio nigripulchritudo TaxID=28173 RepID=UPI0024932DAA|nr:LysR family transcriptional regulator [Vibrio nigripulchritudo]BDU35585.1 LysR family transcriptional regulator [Vibrio nigripulchritudo]BDU41256.1 LysR family transcriptional regulator [Vibrio nigripulchritudo]